jgi:hypothetical protein
MFFFCSNAKEGIFRSDVKPHRKDGNDLPIARLIDYCARNHPINYP